VSASPRDFLTDPRLFGRTDKVSWAAATPEAVAAHALLQHRFCVAVDERLRERALTRTDLARALDVVPATLGKKLRGHDWLQIRDMAAICLELDAVELWPAPGSLDELRPPRTDG